VKVQVFDVDFTIVGCSTVRAFISRGLREGLIGPSIGFYAPLLAARYLMLGPPAEPDGRAYPFLRGISRAALESLARALFDEVLRRKINPAVVSRIETAQRSGERTVIASSSFDTILEPLARHLGVSDMVANGLEFAGGAATGRLEGRPVFGEGKLSRVQDYLKAIGADCAECAFYSDSRRDLPLLDRVGKAVAVNPDGRLRRIARKRGWEIIDAPIGGKDAIHA
jgi:HAD superfamily hydrolase (TIGR01490 family)